MKKIFKLLFILMSFQCFSQDVNFGVEISPSYKIQSIRNKNTGLFSSISGYGFNLGLPIKFNLNDSKSISTGVSFEFSAFDNKVNNFLVSSSRFNAVNLPLTYNYPIIDFFYLNFGTGLNYIFTSKEYGGGIWIKSNSVVNQFQPYISAGISSVVDNNSNTYELGINTRFYIINIWKNITQTSTNILSIDLNMKYFF